MLMRRLPRLMNLQDMCQNREWGGSRAFRRIQPDKWRNDALSVPQSTHTVCSRGYLHSPFCAIQAPAETMALRVNDIAVGEKGGGGAHVVRCCRGDRHPCHRNMRRRLPVKRCCLA